MAAAHPSKHLWPALQRRFSDQTQPSTSPDRLLRAFCVVPLEGQEESAVWTLGFKEVGTTLRSTSLSRDFVAVANAVDPEQPCYLVVYVGDVQLEPAKAGSEAPRPQWALFAYVPPSCTSFEAKKMADNRAGLKAGLGADHFTEGGMWCVHVDQISLSSYMRNAEAPAGGEADHSVYGGAPEEWGEGAGPAHDAAAAAPKTKPPPRRATGDDADAVLGVLPGASLPGLGLGEGELADATEAIWQERIKGVKHAYTDSCTRLVGALEELEETLCHLSGEPYRPDEPILRARAHMEKNLQLMR